MKPALDCLLRNIAAVRPPAERISHPKDGALAQQPEAERAPDSAVVRPQAAGKSRPTSPMSVYAFVSFAADGSVSAMIRLSKGDRGQKLAERAGAADCFVVANHEHKEYRFEPTSRDSFFCFLVQDRLRASDVLHRDWDWTTWL